ncbi:MAG: Wzz/FepE/Etk N-terminal domain-containing protein [Bacteroides sp.]|nr:Wzz/FepE/Etk N-terminal domain-containing protein [Eubacterium sp.]MCM1418923.1 Wzz/FepE/Etk N-terminal domain-containing protein [Roseburia sp.]MCM1461532.1 Wzz/FepE/Etk N-terminal domain-containing protein [Bacteroides sp.]
MKKGFRKLIRTFRRNWRLAAVVVILTTISGYLLSAYVLQKHYVTEARLYVESLDGETPSQKAATLVLLFSSPQMYDAINESLVTGFSYGEYEKMLSIVQKNDTPLLEIRSDCDNADASFKLMEKYLELMPTVIAKYDAKADFSVLLTPEEPSAPAFPDDSAFTVGGAALGAILSLLAILLIWRLDQSITADDDLSEYGVAVLGEVPDFDNEVDYLGR